MSPSDHTSLSQLPTKFAIALALLLIFPVLVVYGEDPFALSRGIVVGIAYVFAIALSVSWLAVSEKRRRAAFVLLVGIVVVLTSVYALSSGSGYPASNVNNVTSYNCTSTTQTNSTGHNILTQTSCTENDYAVQNFPLAFGYNLIVWTPLVGCVLYSMPGWGRGNPKYYELARLLGGSAIAAGILLNLVGIGWSGSLQVLPSIHSPLNPYPATGECDSSTADGGCVYVSHLYVLVDYAFWFSVAILTSLSLGSLASRASGSYSRIAKSVLLAVALLSLLFVGLSVIPSTQNGVLVNSGNSFSFNPSISFIRVPFEVSPNRTLTGGFDASAAVDAYVLNSTQYSSHEYIGYCPIPRVVPTLANVTQGVVAVNLGTGSYSLLICSSVHVPSIQVTVSSPIKLSG